MTYFNDMKHNLKDFIYETPEEIKGRHKAMEYYRRCMRIKEARNRMKQGINEDEIVITEGVTISYTKIQNAIVKLQRQFRKNRSTESSFASQQGSFKEIY